MQTFRKAVKLAADHGWGEYRTPPAFSDLVSSVYSFNEHALRRFIESLKDAADPNGIMSPGRCGIWPSRWRN
jgi:4-cresol dehydrogenase (hydroxylating)